MTFNPAASTALVERQEIGVGEFLENFHRRRGFAQESPSAGGWAVVDDAWAVSVDVVIVALLFWALSGLWMWWELRETRRLGALYAVAGLAVFGFLAFSL